MASFEKNQRKIKKIGFMPSITVRSTINQLSPVGNQFETRIRRLPWQFGIYFVVSRFYLKKKKKRR